MSRDGSPFDCKTCTSRDRRQRNCRNALGLSEVSRCVDAYSEDIKSELRRAGASKVFSLGDLRLYECPLSYLTRDTGEIIRLVYLCDGTGHLLHPGGWGAQPCWLVEAFEIYRRERAQAAENGE